MGGPPPGPPPGNPPPGNAPTVIGQAPPASVMWAWGNQGPASGPTSADDYKAAFDGQEPALNQWEHGPSYTPTTLGWLEYMQHDAFPFMEWWYRRCIWTLLTQRWYLLQGGKWWEDGGKWWVQAMHLLELDRKAQMEFFLLLQAGHVGRAHANKLLWNLLSIQALKKPYRDMSRYVTTSIKWCRKQFDRPPRETQDLSWWSWSCYDDLEYGDMRIWGPEATAQDDGPDSHWYVKTTREGNLPLPPPECWGSWDQYYKDHPKEKAE